MQNTKMHKMENSNATKIIPVSERGERELKQEYPVNLPDI